MSDTAIAIELEVPGVDRVLTQLRAVAAVLDRAGAAARHATSAAAPGVSGGPSFASRPQSQQFTVTTMTIRASAVYLHGSSSQSVNLSQMRNMAASRPQGGSLMDMLGLTRFSPQIAAVTAVVAAFSAVVSEASRELAMFRDSMLTSGGTLNETLQSQTAGAAMGLNSQDMANMARQFADTIAHGGAAAAFANRAGIHDFGTFGEVDKMTNLLKWMKQLRELPEQEAQRQARETGTEPLLKYRQFTMKQIEWLDKEAKKLNDLVGQPQLDAQRDFNFELTRMSLLWQEMTTKYGAGLMRIFSGILQFLNDVNDWWNRMTRDNPGMITGNERAAPRLSAEEEHRRALDRNTEEIRRNTDEYATRNGIYGGGEAARGAVPSKWMGHSAVEYIQQAKRLGAFNL